MENNNKAGKWWIIALVVVVVIIVIAAIVASQKPNAGSSGSQSPTATTTTTSYASPADGFGINFSGSPQVTNSSFDSPTAGSIPTTEYKEGSSDGSTGAYYAVTVYHYPANYQFSNDYLSGALLVYQKEVNIKFPGTVIASQTPTQLLGNPALSAVVTIPTAAGQGKGTVSINNYVLITTKGQNTYVISTYGLPQSDFNSFLGSFTFSH